MENKTHEHFPFIEDIEESLFKAFLVNRKMWVDFKDHILLDYFNNEDHTRLFKIFKVFFDKYKDFPTQAQCTDIAQRKQYPNTFEKKIARVYDERELTKKEVDYLYDECAQFIKNNKIKNAILESVELLEKQKFIDIEHKIQSATSWNHTVLLGTEITDIETNFNTLEDLSKSVFTSPWHAINLAIGGGAYSKELVLFGSSSSVGKTVAIDNWASYCFSKLKKNVLSITLEISEARKAQRMYAEMADIPALDVLNFKDQIVQLFENHEGNNKLIIKEFPTATINIQHLKQFVYQLELYTGFVPDIIFVDYLDIMLPVNRTKDNYEDQGQVGAELRGWAIELNVPIISATQLNRLSKLATIHELSEANLADSYKKLMIADTLIFMHNTTEERQAGRVNIKIGKARNGIKDLIFPLNIDYPKLKMFDLNKKASSISNIAQGEDYDDSDDE